MSILIKISLIQKKKVSCFTKLICLRIDCQERNMTDFPIITSIEKQQMNYWSSISIISIQGFINMMF